MAISPTYGTGVYKARLPSVDIRMPSIETGGTVRYATDLFPSSSSSQQRQSSSNLIANSQEEDTGLVAGLKPSTAIRGGKKLYDMASAAGTSDILSGLGASSAMAGLDVGTAMSGLDVGTSAIGMAGNDVFGLADAFGWGDAGSSVASAASDAGSFFLADVGGFEVPWLAGVDNLFAGDVTGAAEDTIGATVGYALGGPVGGFIGSSIAGPVFEAASDIVEDIGDALGSVICTHLYNTGHLSFELYQADSAYGKKLLLQDPAVYYGYRRWADTVVALMKSSKFILHTVKFLALPAIKAMAEKEDSSIRASSYGRFVLHVGMAVCRLLGNKLPQTIAMRCGV